MLCAWVVHRPRVVVHPATCRSSKRAKAERVPDIDRKQIERNDLGGFLEMTDEASKAG